MLGGVGGASGWSDLHVIETEPWSCVVGDGEDIASFSPWFDNTSSTSKSKVVESGDSGGKSGNNPVNGFSYGSVSVSEVWTVEAA
jgi:hypothetical protein